MTVELSGRLAEAIRKQARAAYPEEACGILVGRRDGERVRVRQALPCANYAPTEERRRRFEIEPRAVLNVQRALRGTQQAIVGFYHSHPGTPPEPSRTDMLYLRHWPETVWLIASVDATRGTHLRAWWLDGASESVTGEAPEVVGRDGPRADPDGRLDVPRAVEVLTLRELDIAFPRLTAVRGCPD